MQMAKEKLSTMDVQLLLWAAGEARERGRRRERAGSPPGEGGGPAERVDFFTEWQPVTP